MSSRAHKRTRPNGRFSGGESGFSLAEVLIAVAIFSVGMLGVGSMLLASIQNDEFNKRKRYAEDVAMDIAERFKARNPDAWPEEGTRRYIYHPHDVVDEETGLADITAMLYDWKIYKCRGCDDGLTECVGLTDSFTCTARSAGEAELPSRLIDIWVGWGNSFTDTNADPLMKCESLTAPTAKCRQKRAHVKTYGYQQ